MRKRTTFRAALAALIEGRIFTGWLSASGLLCGRCEETSRSDAAAT